MSNHQAYHQKTNFPIRMNVKSCLCRLLVICFVSAICCLLAEAQALNYSAPRLDGWQVLGPGGGGAQFNPTVSPVDPNLVLVSCDMTGSYLSTNGGDTWRMFNLRGVVRFFVFDPRQSNILYAATQGLYRSHDKGKSWEMIYPAPDQIARVVMAGDHGDEQIVLRDGTAPRIEALAIDPANSSTLFSVLVQDSKTGLYQSKNNGKSWELLGPLPGGGGRIFVDPQSARQQRTLYIAGANAISVFENGRWTQHPAPEGVRRFLDVSAGFPKAGGKPVIYGISGMNWRGGESGVTGLFRSTDGGASWQTLPVDFLSSAPKEARQLELRAVGTCLTQPDIAYLSFRDHSRSLDEKNRLMGVAKTQDQGKTWQIVWRDTEQASAPNVDDPWITARYGPGWGENPFAFGIAPTNPNLCFGTDFGRTMRTRDGGKTWQGVYARRLEDGTSTTTGLDVLTCNGIHFDPFDVTHWFVSFADLGLFESFREGHAWKEATSRGLPRKWVNTSYWTVFDPEVKGRIWSVVSNIHDLPRPKMWRGRGVKHFGGGVVRSEDGGKTWRPTIDGMGETAATHILIDPGSPAASRILYVCGFGKGVFKSIDGGLHWTLKNNGLEGSEPFAWRLVADTGNHLYLLVARRSDDGSLGNPMDGALYRSRDGAEHWEKLPLPAGTNGPNGLAIDPRDPARLYLAAWGRRGKEGDTGGGIFLSIDAGKNWKQVLTKDQHVFDVTLDPRNPKILYATGFESSVLKSVDQGESWSRIKGYNFKWGQRVFPDPKDPGKIYVCTFGGCIWHGPAGDDPKAAEDILTPVMKPGR